MERIDDQIMQQVAASQAANAQLMKQGFKNQTLFEMMNNCADKCKLTYLESGIADDSKPGVSCYKNCVTKTYKLATQNLQQ